jgi:hypothetical protein
MANQTCAKNAFKIEIYAHSTVRTGKVFCPTASRVTDLLNNQCFIRAPGDEGFIELMESDTDAGQNASKLYFRKSTIELAAVTDADTGRGVGATSDHKSYPFVSKIPKQVTIKLPSYTVSGVVYCSADQSVLAILNEEKAFLPLVSTIIEDNAGHRENRPFAAVNKRQIISLREENQGNPNGSRASPDKTAH